eukprot:EG_transcript_3178
MFWKLGFHNQKSPLEALLEKDDVRLEDVLDQEDIIQEAKAGNDRLIAFLSQPDSVRKLLQFTTEVANGDEVDDKRRFKYPYWACELLVADIPVIDNAIVETAEHMKLLFDFLIQPAPLPQTLSLYFVRVLQTLYTKKPYEVIQYMTRQEGDLAMNFIKHIDTFGMNELILTLLGTMDEENHLQNGYSMSDWWMRHDLMPELFHRLTPDQPPDVHINIIRMLCELIRRFNNPNVVHLADSLMGPEASRQLMSIMLDDLKHNPRSIVFNEGINLAISIIDSLVRKEDACRQMREKLQQMEMYNSEELTLEVEASVNQTLKALLERAEELVEYLKHPGQLEDLHMTWVSLSPPLGLARLKIVELLLVMMKTKKRYIEEELARLDMINICLDLFFQYDMNNLLHILVDEIVTSCLVSDNVQLITHLFDKCRILERILLAAEDDLDASRQRQGRRLRKGYFGHITSMSNKIQQSEDQQPIVKEYTGRCDAWREYVTTTLAARNATDTLVLGGANASGIQSGDLLCGPDNYSYSNQLPDLEGLDSPVAETYRPVAAAHKYAPSTNQAGDAAWDVWEEAALDDQDARSSNDRDAAFDLRDVFPAEEHPKGGSVETAEEEVWQERQIVDNSANSSDPNWGEFNDAPDHSGASSGAADGKFKNLGWLGDSDDSSSDEEPQFVPSPTKTAGDNEPPATPAPAPPAATAVANCSPSEPVAGVADVEADGVAGRRKSNPQVNDEGDYTDFNFWKPNWGDISS